MPRPHRPEFRQRAFELVRLRDKPVAQIAKELGISDSCLRGWGARADVDDGHKPGLTSGRAFALVSSPTAGDLMPASIANMRSLVELGGIASGARFDDKVLGRNGSHRRRTSLVEQPVE